jgi:hypothetical protein
VALEKCVAERGPAEKITGVAAYVSFGDPGPAIEAFAGKVGSAPEDPPVRHNTLFQTGSTSKSLTAALSLSWRPRASCPLTTKVGALLVREWNGRLERVMVLEEGFAWNGQTFGSLSQIAKAMTGTTWNVAGWTNFSPIPA